MPPKPKGTKVLSVDFDGSLDSPETQSALKDKIKAYVAEGYLVVLKLNSDRQDYAQETTQIDFGRSPCFPLIKALVESVQKELDDKAAYFQFDKTLSADLMNELTPGTAMASVGDYKKGDIPDKEKKQIRGLADKTKLSLMYAQLQLASIGPDGKRLPPPIEVEFTDDKPEVILGAKRFFEENPDFIPEGMVVKFTMQRTKENKLEEFPDYKALNDFKALLSDKDRNTGGIKQALRSLRHHFDFEEQALLGKKNPTAEDKLDQITLVQERVDIYDRLNKTDPSFQVMGTGEIDEYPERTARYLCEMAAQAHLEQDENAWIDDELEASTNEEYQALQEKVDSDPVTYRRALAAGADIASGGVKHIKRSVIGASVISTGGHQKAAPHVRDFIKHRQQYKQQHQAAQAFSKCESARHMLESYYKKRAASQIERKGLGQQEYKSRTSKLGATDKLLAFINGETTTGLNENEFKAITSDKNGKLSQTVMAYKEALKEEPVALTCFEAFINAPKPSVIFEASVALPPKKTNKHEVALQHFTDYHRAKDRDMQVRSARAPKRHHCKVSAVKKIMQALRASLDSDAEQEVEALTGEEKEALSKGRLAGIQEEHTELTGLQNYLQTPEGEKWSPKALEEEEDHFTQVY